MAQFDSKTGAVLIDTGSEWGTSSLDLDTKPARKKAPNQSFQDGDCTETSATQLQQKAPHLLHTTYYKNFFLLRTVIVVNGQQAQVGVDDEGWLTLNCRNPTVGVTFDSLVTDVNEVLQQHGLYGVSNYWCEEVPLFEVKGTSQKELEKLFSLQGEIQEHLALKIHTRMKDSLQPAAATSFHPGPYVEVQSQLYLLIPDHVNKDANPIKIKKTNFEACLDLFSESRLFDFGAVFRASRDNPSRRDTGPEAFCVLVEELHEVVNWHSLGLFLKIPEYQLQIIRQNSPQNTEMCRTKMLSWWWDNSEERKWATLVQALGKIGYQVLASKMALKYGVPVPCCIHESTSATIQGHNCGLVDMLGALVQKLRTDIDDQDQGLAQRDQSFQQAQQERSATSEQLKTLKFKLSQSQSRIRQLMKERDDTVRALKLQEFEFQVMRQSATKQFELQQQSISHKEKEIANLKMHLQFVEKELNETKPLIPALKEELLKASLELESKTTEVQLLRETRTDMRLALDTERKVLDNYLLQQMAASVSQDRYNQEVEMQLHYLKVMSENSVKEMEAFQENLQKRDPEIKEIVQRISDQNARRKNSSLSLKHETGLVDMSDMTSTKEKVHELVMWKFDTPTKCDTCNSVMDGLGCEGLVCKNCQLKCHVHCKDKVVPTCPLPPGQDKLPFGIDVHCGVGTDNKDLILIPELPPSPFSQLSTHSALMPTRPNEEWMERRTLRRDQQDLLDLQLSLKAEIEAKSKIAEDFEKLRTENEKLMQQLQQSRLRSQSDSSSLSGVYSSPVRKMSAKESVHELVVRTFDGPTKCDVCTSVMFGLVRQGLVCKNCRMSCHVHCEDKAVPTCPLPPGQAKLPFGIDVHHGVGTACEGWIKIPKPGGVRRGWQRAYAIVCDFKVFLHEPSNDIHTPANSALHIFDIRDIKVSRVAQQDVIHAGPKLIPAIFKMSCNQSGCPGITNEVLVLTENETERDRWLATLEELQKAAKQSTQHGSPVFSSREMYSANQLEVLKGTQSAAIMTPDHLLIGNSEGLYMLDIREKELYKFEDKDVRKVTQISVISDEGLIVLLAGRQHQSVRLLPVSATESGETKNVITKITESESCSSFSCGSLAHTWYICVAVKTRVLIFQINKTKNRYEKRREISLSSQVQSLKVLGDNVCVGYQSGCSLYHLYIDQPPQKLVHDDDLTLGFVHINNLPAMHVVQINNGQEYILCFNVVGVYVNQNGNRSRKQELLWHSSPSAFAFMAPYLLVYCESALEIYDVNTAKWIQTIPFTKLNCLSEDGCLASCSICDPPILLYIKKQVDEDAIHMPGLTRVRIRTSKRTASQKREKAAISGPINFTHTQHFGPYESLNPDEMPDAGVTSAPKTLWH